MILMNRYTIPPVFLLILLFGLNYGRNNEYILWIQGNTTISLLTIVWLLFLIIIFIEILYFTILFRTYYLILFLVILGTYIGLSIKSEFNSVTTSYFYEESNHKILVVDNKNIIFGEIKFYYKDNYGLSKEFASCHQNHTLLCDYYIEDDNLIINLHSSRDEIERIVPIPSK